MLTTERFPDTIFLPDRAKLAINCLTQCLNPDKHFLPYCLMDLTGTPPRMRHTQFDYSDHTSRVIDALLLAQTMVGTSDGDEQLAELVPLFDKGFDSDGLHYTPENPWSFRHANMHYQRSVINALLSLMLVRGSAKAEQQLRGLTKGLANISIKREGFWYFPSVERLPEGWPRGDWGILSFGVDPANTNGRLLFGLTRAYEALKDANARDLAAGYANHVMSHSSAFLPDGSFATGMEFREGHFHSRAVTMLGVIRYGHGFGNARAVEWGKRVYDKARQYGTSFGWFPERLVKTRAHGCETCAIVDMMEAAIWLAKSGHSEYWEDAERFLRNQLLESQLTNIDWLGEGHTCDSHAHDEWETTRDVAKRSLGGFAGWSQPNDFVSKVMHEWDLYMCCSAQGVRGLFNAWANAVTAGDRDVRVNLLINSISDHATVRSWLPHEGRVQVVTHREAEVMVRIPSWVDHRRLKVAVAGASVPIRFSEANYVTTDVLPRNSVVEVSFPVRTASTKETVLDVTYTIDWRGDTVMDISPPGTSWPLYRRQVMAEGTVPDMEKAVPKIGFQL